MMTESGALGSNESWYRNVSIYYYYVPCRRLVGHRIRQTGCRGSPA